MTSRTCGSSDLRAALGGDLTERTVEAVEHLEGDGTTYLQVGDLEQLDGAMWLVAGIFEPALPRGAWLVAHVRRTRSGTEVRLPPVRIGQADVVRVHDAVRESWVPRLRV